MSQLQQLPFAVKISDFIYIQNSKIDVLLYREGTHWGINLK